MYPWLKSLHIAAAMLWLGGSVALALITVAVTRDGSGRPETFAMIRRLWVRVTSSAMMVVWVMGLTMASTAGAFGSSWVRIKLCVALLLTAWHGAFSGRLRRLVLSPTDRLGRGWQASIAVMVALLAVAVASAVFKPS